MSFDQLGLRAELLRAIGDAGYTTPTPVQAQAIPVILQAKDVLAGAQTGTGKTAGFTVPLLQRLNTTPVSPARTFRPVRALILTPTRELAAQVEESVRTYGKYLPTNSACIFGGVNINPQIQTLRRGVDILIATPGRLLDHIEQRTLNLGQVEILVLDEADRMLDMGFIRDIRRIVALLPTRRQNLLFSATFSAEIKTLAAGLLRNPVYVEVAAKNAASDLVTQAVYLTAKEQKFALLEHLMVQNKIEQALVFVRTKHGADKVARQLQRDGIAAVPIHGNRSQSQRTRALADFKAGTMRILVATDIAARGLDIDQLPYVINYELPNVPQDYVHRIGRTGRAGSTGEALSLVCADEQGYLSDIERLIQRRIDRREPVDFHLVSPLAHSIGIHKDGIHKDGIHKDGIHKDGTYTDYDSAPEVSAPRPSARPRSVTAPRYAPARPQQPRPRITKYGHSSKPTASGSRPPRPAK